VVLFWMPVRNVIVTGRSDRATEPGEEADVRRHQTPVLITAAPVSLAEQFAARRRRYSLLMAMRIPCLVLAGVLALAFGWTIAAAVLVIASVPLPWVAVLIANDGPPRKAEKIARYRTDARPLSTTTVRGELEPVVVIDVAADAVADHVVTARTVTSR
jgi:hypothetical protein